MDEATLRQILASVETMPDDGAGPDRRIYLCGDCQPAYWTVTLEAMDSQRLLTGCDHEHRDILRSHTDRPFNSPVTTLVRVCRNCRDTDVWEIWTRFQLDSVT